MVGVLAMGFIANALVRPVDAKHHEPEETVAAAQVGSEDATERAGTAAEPAEAGAGAGGAAPAAAAGANGGLHTVAALALAGVVCAGLLYGLVQTVIKAAALF